MKKIPEAIIRCYVCGKSGVTIHSVKVKNKTAYVCSEHNIAVFTEHLPLDAFDRSRLTREHALKIRGIQMLKEKEKAAHKRVVAAKDLGIV